jgi:Putative beta-barrel porin-2, OmpL-like. bbp2
VWDTIIGYEVFNPADNPNFSRSYGYFIEPFAHTGVLASYRVSDELSISAGIANSTSTAFNSNAINGRGDGAGFNGGEFRTRFMAAVAYTIPEDAGFLKGSTLYGGVVTSEDGATAGGPGEGYNVYLGGTLATPVEGLRVGVAFDALVADQAADTYVYGLYATYQASEQVRISGRGEFVQDNAGAIFGGNQEVMALVGTVDYKLWENVLTRAEVRWDKDVDGGSGNAFGGQDNQVQFVLNMVYSF